MNFNLYTQAHTSMWSISSFIVTVHIFCHHMEWYVRSRPIQQNARFQWHLCGTNFVVPNFFFFWMFENADRIARAKNPNRINYALAHVAPVRDVGIFYLNINTCLVNKIYIYLCIYVRNVEPVGHYTSSRCMDTCEHISGLFYSPLGIYVKAKEKKENSIQNPKPITSQCSVRKLVKHSYCMKRVVSNVWLCGAMADGLVAHQSHPYTYWHYPNHHFYRRENDRPPNNV